MKKYSKGFALLMAMSLGLPALSVNAEAANTDAYAEAYAKMAAYDAKVEADTQKLLENNAVVSSTAPAVLQTIDVPIADIDVNNVLEIPAYPGTKSYAELTGEPEEFDYSYRKLGYLFPNEKSYPYYVYENGMVDWNGDGEEDIDMAKLWEYYYGLELNATNFPNEAFRNAVQTAFDTNTDGKLDSLELMHATTLEMWSQTDIDNLSGIEYLKNLQVFLLAGSGITELNFQCPELLSSLTLMSNRKLTTLNIALSKATDYLHIGDHAMDGVGIENFSLSGTPEEYIYISMKNNNLSGTLDLSMYDILSLDVRNNKLTNIILDPNDEVFGLNVSNNCLACFNAPILYNYSEESSSYNFNGNVYSTSGKGINLLKIKGFQLDRIVDGSIVNGYLDGSMLYPNEGQNTVTYSYKINNEITTDFSVVFGTDNLTVADYFTDVTTSDWFYDSVQYCYDNGIMTGKGASFDAAGSITRSEFVTTLYSIAGKPSVNGVENKFSDVENAAWYTNPILWASSTGCVSGYGDGRFGVYDSITREQIALILYKNGGSILTNIDTTAIDKFNDKTAISSYATTALNWAVTNGIMSGTATGNLNPGAPASRAECATMLRKYCTLIEAAK